MSPRSHPAPGATGSSGVILAAGRSSRMEGKHKLLRDLGGGPVIRRVAETALGAGLLPLVVVIRDGAPGIRSALAGLDLILSPVPRGPEGRLVSAVTGIETLLRADFGSRGATILLGDEPGVSGRHVAAVLAAAGQPPVPSRARYTDRDGHPVHLPAEVLSSIPALARGCPPDTRLWDLLERSGPCRVARLDGPSPIDIDTAGDLDRALERGFAD